MGHKYQLVTLLECKRDLTALAVVCVFGQKCSLDDTVLGHHSQVFTLGKLVDRDHSRDLFTLGELQHVVDMRALGGSGRLGNHKCTQHLHAAKVSKQHQIGVRVHHDHLFDKVLFLGGQRSLTHAAAVLCGIFGRGLTLDVAAVRQSNDAIVLFDQILQHDIVLGFLNSRASLVTKLALDLGHFITNDRANTIDITENCSVFHDRSVQSSQLFFNLLALQAAKTTQRHGNDGLRLLLGEVRILCHGKCLQIERSGRTVVGLLTVEACHQVFLGGRLVLGRTDDVNHLVEIINRQFITLVNMRLTQSSIQLVLRAAGDDRLLMADIMIQHLGEVERFGLVAHDGKHVDRAGILQLRILVELI